MEKINIEIELGSEFQEQVILPMLLGIKMNFENRHEKNKMIITKDNKEMSCFDLEKYI